MVLIGAVDDAEIRPRRVLVVRPDDSPWARAGRAPGGRGEDFDPFEFAGRMALATTMVVDKPADRLHGRPSTGILRGADHRERRTDQTEFADFVEMQEYAQRKRPRLRMGEHRFVREAPAHPAARQFRVRAVRTKRGTTMIGLFSKPIARAEWEADRPYRQALAAKRLTRMARAERRWARLMERRKGG
jgi:hypothetical protein